MSVCNKVNVKSSGLHCPELKRLLSEGKYESCAGIFASGHQSTAWISSGGRLAVVGANEGNLYSMFSFGEDSNDPVDVTCVEEFEVDRSKLTPLVLACTSSLRQDRLHVVNPANSRVLRNVDLGKLQVRCMTVVDNGCSPLNSLTEVLAEMSGVVALGCSNGAVILVDLHRELVVRAYREYWRSTESTQTLKYISDTDDDETKRAEIEEAQSCGSSAAITLIEGDDSDADCGVTALSFSRETACLYVGYSSGLWQIWNLAVPDLSMLYECAECTNPVASFCQIEPCEDPRPTVYVWVNHEGTDVSMPLFNMYSVCYQNKMQVPDYGTYYQDFIACSLSFSMFPGEEFANVVSGKLLSSAPYSNTLKRSLIQNMGLPEMEGIQMKLVITAFSLTYTRGSTHTYLTVFDLDQWYKEQMPIEPNCGGASFLETIELSSEPLLASAVVADSVSIFQTEVPQEIHLVPQALSFNVIGLSESGLLHIEKIGLQKLWLINTDLIGAKSLVHPTKLFHACVSAGLIPTFPTQVNNDVNSPTNEEMRSYILSVWLENGLEHVILEVAIHWENGAHAASNCTLNFLFDWVWSSVSSTYNAVSIVCETLFSASGHEIDVGVKRRLQHCRLMLCRLHYIQTAFCSKYSNPLYKGMLETRFKAIDIIKLFVVQLTWFMNAGLLPEANSEDKPRSAVRYEGIKLEHYASERRQHLSNVSAKLKRAGKPSEMPGGSLYLVDHLLHDYLEIGRQWEEEGGTNAYPPPSIQSLLRTLRLQNIPTSAKLSVVQYALLDIVHVMDKAKHEHLIPTISKYHFIHPEGHVISKVVQGLWHLDHGFHKEGLDHLLHRSITVSDMPERLHRAIVRVLFFDGKAHLALQYLRLRNPRLTLPEDLKMEMSLLLAKKLTSEAYHFQKQHSFLRNDLLGQFFAESLSNGEIGKVINFPLDDYELRVFDDYLARNVSQRNDDIRVLLRLTRKKYNEAKYLHDRLLALHEPKDSVRAENRDMIVKGLLSTIPKVSQLVYLTKQKGEYKKLPEYKSSKPRPLGLFPIGANGKPILNPTEEQLCGAALAAIANFVKHNPELEKTVGVFDEEPKIYPVEAVSPQNSFDGTSSRKRSLTTVLVSNKRRRMDVTVDDTADDDISAFVGTPLVKRRSMELADMSTPHSTAKQSKVHSILKSNKTPGTPGRSVAFEGGEGETPKKTLRWDIPSEGGSTIQRARKSLLSSSLSSPSKELSTPTKATAQDAPQPIDSIKNRLRSHTGTPTSVNKRDTPNWSEIAEEVKPKVLFSVGLPQKKEKPSKPAKPVGPSFVEQLNILKSEEERRKHEQERPSTATLLAAGEFPDVELVHRSGGHVETEEMDVSAERDLHGKEEDSVGDSSSPDKPKFDNLTLDSDELSLLNVSSPFTTRTVPRRLREQILAKLHHDDAQEGAINTGRSKAGQISSAVESGAKGSVENDSESNGSDEVKDSDDYEVKIKGIEEEGNLPYSEGRKWDAKRTSSSEHKTNTPQIKNVDAIRKSAVGQEGTPKRPPTSEEAVEAEEDFAKVSTDSSVHDDVSAPSKPKTDVLSAQPPIATKVVSLSRSPYPDDEDEVGSEDPEEAEIPPVIEFSQPEEGLLIDANYSLKGQLEEGMGDSEDVDNDLRGLARIAGEESPDDSGSSVICIDSESDDGQKNQTPLDYEGEDSYTFDSEEAGNSSRGRRSFFHDKYNTHQEESESPSPEYSSEEGQRDVDLYNMDAIDQEDDEMSKEVDLEDEIFGLGRGLQRSKEDVSSENEDEEEIYDDEPADVQDSGDSESDSDVQEISSEEEEPSPKEIINPKARLREMLLAASAGTSTTAQTEDQLHSPTSQSAEEEVGITEEKQEPESDELLEGNTPAIELVEREPATPSKTPDVIDFNLSQGQMFFGSPPESEASDARSDRALFQWKTFTSNEQAKDEAKEALLGGETKSEEALNLQIEEDILPPENCALLPETPHTGVSEPIGGVMSEEAKPHETLSADCPQEFSGEPRSDLKAADEEEKARTSPAKSPIVQPGESKATNEAGLPLSDKTVEEVVSSTVVGDSNSEGASILSKEQITTTVSKDPVDNKSSPTVDKSIVPPVVGADMKSFSCQTSFLNAASSETGVKSFSCQAAMDTTRTVAKSSTHSEGSPETLNVEKKAHSLIIPEIIVQSPNGDEHSLLLLEPPTPFKSTKSGSNSQEVEQSVPSSSKVVESPRSESGRPSGSMQGLKENLNAADLSGVRLLNDDEDEQLTIEEEENLCDVAFVGESSSFSVQSVPATPKTPLRKSTRLSRMATPGRALAPDDEVNVSDSILDVATVDIEVSEEKPITVDRSVITDERGDVACKPKASKRPSKPSRNSTAANEEADRRSRSRSKSVDPERVGRDEAHEVVRRSRTSALSSETGLNEDLKVDNTATQHKVVKKGRDTAQSTEQPTLRKSPRKPLVVDQLSTETVAVRRSPRIRRSSESGSSVSSVQSTVSTRDRRCSSADPESHRTRHHVRGSRASSECPELSSQGSQKSSVYSEDTASVLPGGCHSRKRSLGRASESPPKLVRMSEPSEAVSDQEYRKRKIRHSITEPLDRKRHMGGAEPKAGPSRSSEPGYRDEDSGEETSRPRKKARSLHDYPTRKSSKLVTLESIKEVPEDSFEKRASAEDLTASSSRMRPCKPIDISKWLALSKSQVSKARRLAGKPEVTNSPVVEKQTCFSLGHPPSSDEATPEVERSPGTESVVSVASTTSSKVLRSGRTIDENTPTRRPRRSSFAKRQLTKKSLPLSPRKSLRSRLPAAVDDNDDGTSGTTDSSDGGSVSTVASSRQTSTSASLISQEPAQEMNIDEIMSTRRLTRKQRSLLESSMASRRGLSPVEESPAASPKGKTRKNRESHL